MTQAEQRLVNAENYVCRFGIVEYKFKGKYLIFNKSYLAYLGNPRYTVQHTVDLDTGVETTKILKRYDPKGRVNI